MYNILFEYMFAYLKEPKFSLKCFDLIKVHAYMYIQFCVMLSVYMYCIHNRLLDIDGSDICISLTQTYRKLACHLVNEPMHLNINIGFKILISLVFHAVCRDLILLQE